MPSTAKESSGLPTSKKKSFPIHLHITTVFIALFVLVSVISAWYTYGKTSELLRVAADDAVNSISSNIQQKLTITYRPVISAVDALSHSGVTKASTAEQRLKFLPMLAEATTMQGQVEAFQIGYSSGDYLIVRNISKASRRSRFGAPQEAYYIADDIERDDLGAVMLRRFFDQDLKQIGDAQISQTDFDPRNRPWYKINQNKTVISEPYLFYFLERIGITMSRSGVDGDAVVAADVTLDSMSKVLASGKIFPSAELVLSFSDGVVVAYDSPANALDSKGGVDKKMRRLDELGSPIVKELYHHQLYDDEIIEHSYDGKLWLGKSVVLPIGNYSMQLTAVFPEDELLNDALLIRRETHWVHFFILLFSLPLVWFVARRISVPIQMLARQARSIEKFDFSEPEEINSAITEVEDLSISMRLMRNTIRQYNHMISAMTAEKDFTRLLQMVAKSTREISRADIAAVYLMNDDSTQLDMELAQIDSGDTVVEITEGVAPIRLDDESTDKALLDSIELKEYRKFSFPINRLSKTAEQQAFAKLKGDHIDVASLPLVDRNGDVVGVLMLGVGDDSSGHKFSGQWLGFIEQLSSFSALSIENRQLIKMQKELMESFIKLIASAIDAKSPYTGGHCQRVPEITKMLAKAACEDTELYSDFDLNEDQWEELHFACWLHDCGKVTTPEYVVDKSTKLETIYDRIHEVRMRFEVLKRDAELEYWQCLHRGGDEAMLKSTLDATLAQLDDDYAFIAECNEGGEFMAPDRIERLKALAEKTWTRTLSDRVGISWEEAQRKSRVEESPLPCKEPLLGDKEEHIIERSEADTLDDNNPWGFKMPSPEHKYNRGEVYNLSVARGTLSEEERYKINDHMIQTIIMLEKLPYPKHLRNVPVIAGGHHEKMDGTGYPKKLSKDDMPLTARMMAIADIFEALTAADRPYKKAKTLSEAIRIMGFMKKDNHIDPDLFELFLRSGAYLEYAEKFLSKEQIDTVDINQYLSS